MDDNRKHFSKSEQEQILDRIHGLEREDTRGCEYCGHEVLFVIPTPVAFSAPILKEGKVVSNTQSTELPAAAVVCENCGQTRFFNLHILGIELKGDNDGEV